MHRMSIDDIKPRIQVRADRMRARRDRMERKAEQRAAALRDRYNKLWRPKGHPLRPSLMNNATFMQTLIEAHAAVSDMPRIYDLDDRRKELEEITWEIAEATYPGCSAQWDAQEGPRFVGDQKATLHKFNTGIIMIIGATYLDVSWAHYTPTDMIETQWRFQTHDEWERAHR
jgi:hypothetical protein